MVKYCAINVCPSSSHEKERRFFGFPSEDKRCDIWIRATGREDLFEKKEALRKYYYICDLHFRESDHYKKKLKCNAVPVYKISTNRFVAQSTQTGPGAEFMKDFGCQANMEEIIQSTQTISYLVLWNAPVKHKLPEDLQSPENEIRPKQGKHENENVEFLEVRVKEEIVEKEDQENFPAPFGTTCLKTGEAESAEVRVKQEIVENENQENFPAMFVTTCLENEESESAEVRVKQEIVENDNEENFPAMFVTTCLETEETERAEVRVKQEIVQNEDQENFPALFETTCLKTAETESKISVKEEKIGD